MGLKERFAGNFKGDLFGGLTAGIVALPLALGFGVASGIDGLDPEGVFGHSFNGAALGMFGAICVGLMASHNAFSAPAASCHARWPLQHKGLRPVVTQRGICS